MNSSREEWRRFKATPRPPETYPSYSYRKDLNRELHRLIRGTIVNPISAVEWNCGEQWALIDRLDPDSYWKYIVAGSGTGWFQDDRTPFAFSSGDMVLIPENTVHSILPDPGKKLRLLSIHFFARYRGTMDVFRLLGLRGVFPDDSRSTIANRSSNMCRDFAVRAPGWERSMEAWLWEIILYLLRTQPITTDIESFDDVATSLKRIMPALEVVSTRIADPALKVQNLAEAIHISEPHMRHLMRSALGMSPAEFICSQRIDVACRKLQVTSDTVESIAFDCGFRSAEYFYRVFKKKVGRTPIEYRRGLN